MGLVPSCIHMGLIIMSLELLDSLSNRSKLRNHILAIIACAFLAKLN